jgi:hypothetical protein
MTPPLEAVASQPTGSQRLDRLAQTVARNFKPTVASALAKANDLAYWLYLRNQPERALLVCQQFDAIAFANNYHLWSWVELALALEARILREQDQPQRAAQVVDKIRGTYATGDPALQRIKAQALARRLNGDLLPFDQITQSEADGDARAANEYRFAAWKELVFVGELGGSTRWPGPAIEQVLAEHRPKLRLL